MLPPTDQPLSSERHQQVRDEIAGVMGVINVAEARLVELAATVLAEQHHVGPGIHSPAHFLAWRTGLSLGHCQDLVRLARRRDELPTLTGALAAGELTIDQAAVVARHVPPEYEASATEFARNATVAQLKTALPAYGYEPRTRPADHGVTTGTDDRGWWIRGRLSDEQGAVVDRALVASRDDLWRAARADTPEGEPVPQVSSADALAAVAETALQAGEAARPGSDRYRVHLHLEASPDGTLLLATHLGVPLPATVRRHLLCDAAIAAVVRRGITPVGVGRTTRVIGRQLRRLIEHRDGGCRVPGCGRTAGLEIHHIHHWEDGGATEESNLITLCHPHHRDHHRGLLTIAGTAAGLEIRDQHGDLLEPTGSPQPPALDPAAGARTPATEARAAARAVGLVPGSYRSPTGERLRRRDVHLTPTPSVGRCTTGPPRPTA